MAKIEYRYGSRIIAVELVHANRKTIDLRVFPEGNVVITAPMHADVGKIMEKVKPKSKWILQQQRLFELYKPYTTPRLYTPGESHRYLGRQYKLVVKASIGGPAKISLSKGHMIVETTMDKVEDIVAAYYKSRATIVFNKIMVELLEEFPQFKAFNIQLSHRMMKKRWGSCSVDQRILLNTELVKASKVCIEYVILHELCHLIHPNHTSAFYEYLTLLMPKWKKVKEKLEVTLA